MKKSISRIIGVIMLIVAIVFIMFALNHPEKSFPSGTAGILLSGSYCKDCDDPSAGECFHLHSGMDPYCI